MAQCDVQNAQKNSAKSALDVATSAYIQCLPLADRQNLAIQNARPALEQSLNEAKQIEYMSTFLLRQMERHADSNTTLGAIQGVGQESLDTMNREIEDLKANIRLERRKFLDSDPQKGTAIAGIYFLDTPDNQVLLAFVLTFGAFWLVLGGLILGQFVSGPGGYFERLLTRERYSLVGGTWLGVAVLTYIGLYTFT
jgi:hypothetical protein